MPILAVMVSDENGQIYLCNVLHDRRLWQCMGNRSKRGYGSIYTPVSTVNMCYASVYGCLLVLEMVYLCTALNLLQNGGTISTVELCFDVFGLCTRRACCFEMKFVENNI